MRRVRPPGTVVRTAADLTALWESLMGPGGFGVTSVWLVFLDAENRVLPAIVPIDDLPTEPDRDFLHSLLRIVADLIDSGSTSSVAMLLSRPGPAAISGPDRRWARALRAELGDRLTTWPIHLATPGRVRVFAPDDLLG
ncbi:MAG TPA: hypothetical protein VFU35_16000 [Jatrophihabitans sp.]|nr:hypothetical protein [Jatrophihabitans sp.]